MELLQTSVPELYLPNPPPSGGGLAYLLPRATQGAPKSLTGAESWSAWPGAYLILSQPVATGGEAAFAAAAWAFLEDPRLAGTRFAWLETPPAPALFTGPAIQVSGSGAGATVALPANVPLGDVAVGLAAGTAIALAGDESAFEFIPKAAGDLTLTSQWGSAEIGTVGPQATLPLSGALAGCLQLSVAFQLDDASAIDAGMRWFYAVPPDLEEPLAPAEDFFLESLRVPLLSGESTLYANLDPLAPLEGDRSYLAFAAGDAGQTAVGGGASIPSYLRTTLGGKVALRPLTGAAAPSHFAALVFARNQVASAASPRDPLYLVPRGDFGLEPEADRKLMCGLSGVEYVELPPASGEEPASTVSFFPESAAYAAGFFPCKQPGFTALDPSSMPTTSYAQVTGVGSPPLTYFAQPDQSVLYNHGAFSPEGFTALAAQAVEAGGIAAAPSAAASFPLLPYAGAEGELEPFAQLESQIVNPLRRKRIAAAGTAAPRRVEAEMAAPTSKLSTTPQGLLAAYKPGADEWEEVVLARMVGKQQLELSGVKGDLLSAFQSNKMFLVVSVPTSVTIPSAASQIVIGADSAERWIFNLESGRGGKWREQADSRTILILKYHSLSIAELAQETAAWASPETFNENPEEISRRLVETIAAADHADPDYAAFLAAVEDPNWNGILALNVECPLEKLPSQLAGLAAGIDPKAFYAHHLGIALSKIDASKLELAIEESSIFGLLHYEDKNPLAPQLGEYAFTVRQLKVSFLQSAVAGFSSLIELQVNGLFGEASTLQKPTGENNAVELFGVYQKHVVGAQIEESYVFQTKTGQSSVFTIESGVLNAVTITKGQFVTLTEKDTAEQTLSQFIFWGQLDFQALAGFDAFSFGREAPGDEATGLAFGNLVIGMSFDPKVEPSVPTFEFDATKLALDVAASPPPRPHSLFKHFPLTVAGFTQGAKGTTPDGLGFMGVQTPLTQTTLTFPWFSLNYDLDLGSPGALAAEAGFVAGLSIAWMPNQNGYRVFTGLRLPGSSGAKRQISIEGIFDITFRTLAILSPTPDTYVLLLFGIGFEFLSFTFPPSGQVNFVLFGNPGPGAAGETTIGWYAAYAKKDSKSTPGEPSLTAPPPPLLIEPGAGEIN